MPKWLMKQLMNAFVQRDRRQIIFLNKCWFSYLKKEQKKASSNSTTHTQLGSDS